MTKSKTYTKAEVKNLKHSEIEITASISADTLDEHHKKAVEHYKKTIKVDGFREGSAPEEVVLKNIGEQVILEKAANTAIEAAYIEILQENKIIVLTAPQVTITKLALGNDLEFKINAITPPEVKLPDYQKIAKKAYSKKDDTKVTDREVAEVLTHFRRERLRFQLIEEKKVAPADAAKQITEAKEKDLPELDIDFIKQLGDFKDVKEFELKVRENAEHEKEMRASEKQRATFVDEITKKTDIDLPLVLIEHELARIQGQLEQDLSQSGTKIEDYLKNINKTLEDAREDWKPDAEKFAKLQLILNNIAEEQKIAPNEETINKEVTHVLEHHKDANREHVHANVTMHLRNNLVFAWIEAGAIK